jgi:hypothetical protein
LVNPENGKTITTRMASNWTQSYTDFPDGSYIIDVQFSGLNLLYKGTSVLTLAGRATAQVLVQFDKRGNPIVTVTEDFTPHQAHAYSYLCDLLG